MLHGTFSPPSRYYLTFPSSFTFVDREKVPLLCVCVCVCVDVEIKGPKTSPGLREGGDGWIPLFVSALPILLLRPTTSRQSLGTNIRQGRAG